MAKIGSVNIGLLRPEFEQSNKLMKDSLESLTTMADPLKTAIDGNLKYLQEDQLGQLKTLAQQLVPKDPTDPAQLEEYLTSINDAGSSIKARRLGLNANKVNEVANLAVTNNLTTQKEYLGNQDTLLKVTHERDKQKTISKYNEIAAKYSADPNGAVLAEQEFTKWLSDNNITYDIRDWMAEADRKDIGNYAAAIAPSIATAESLTSADYAQSLIEMAQKTGIDLFKLSEETGVDLVKLMTEYASGGASAKTTAPTGSSYPSSSSTSVGASSGFGAVVNKGESGAAAYNAVNYGSGKGSGTVDASSMTVGQVVQQMNAGKLAAFGKYQFNVGSFPEAVTKLKLDPNAKMTPEMQDKIFANWYAGDKRPDIKNYITGKSNDVNKAITSASAEWRALQNIDGKIFKADGHNKATITPETTKAGLDASRKAYAAAIKAGHSEADAYRIAITNADSVLGGSSVNTATSKAASYKSKTDKELIGTSKVISNNPSYSALAKRSSDLIRLMGHHLDRSGKVINNDDKFKKYSKEYADIKSSMKEILGKDFPEWEKVTKAMWTNAFKNMDARAAKEKGGTTSTGNSAPSTGNSAPSVPQGKSPFKVSSWSNNVQGKELRSKLTIKNNAATSAGNVAKPTAEFAEIVQGQLGKDFKYFSSFNDTLHQGKKSYHNQGTAFDLVLRDGVTKQEAAAATNRIRSMAKAAGYEVRILDEYNHPSEGSTGGHIHVTVAGTSTPGGSAALEGMGGMIPPQLAKYLGLNPEELSKLYDGVYQGYEDKRSLIKDTLGVVGANPASNGFGFSSLFKKGGMGGTLGFSMPGMGGKLDQLFARNEQALAGDAAQLPKLRQEAERVIDDSVRSAEEVISGNFEASESFLQEVQEVTQIAQLQGKTALPISTFIKDFEGFKRWLGESNITQEAFEALSHSTKMGLVEQYQKFETSEATDADSIARQVKQKATKFIRPNNANSGAEFSKVMVGISSELYNKALGDLEESTPGLIRSALTLNTPSSKQDKMIKEDKAALTAYTKEFERLFSKQFLNSGDSALFKYMTEEHLSKAATMAWDNFARHARLRGLKPWEALQSNNRNKGIEDLEYAIKYSLTKVGQKSVEEFEDSIQKSTEGRVPASYILDQAGLKSIK